MFKVGSYEPGSNLTIMNTMYQYSKKNEETDKWEKDYLIVVYKDNNTGIKYAETIYEPLYTWYLLKPEYQVSENQHFMELEKLTPVTCKYNEITRSIAERTGNFDLYKDNIATGNSKANKAFFTHPRVYGADMNIKNFVRTEFAETYQNPVCPISILFFDIESDIINSLSDNIVIGECPVNCISMYFTQNKTMYTLVLRNSLNKQIQELEDKIKYHYNDFKQYCLNMIEQQVGTEKLKHYNLDNININFGFFDTEQELLISFWQMIKQLDPDIVTAWNIFGYDIRQILGRMEVLKLNIEDIVCDINMYPKICNLFLDERNINEITERNDYIDISLKSVFVDQEIIYASRRKNEKKPDSTALDYVGGKECDVHKYDYHEITTNIAKFPWLNFELFVLYNIIDVIVQACIEAQTEDIKFMFNNVIEMNTPYDKIWRQTVFLTTKAYQVYKENGVIMGENLNKFKPKPDSKFVGAYVALPTMISNKNKELSNGRPIMKYNNANDFDYKSLYPSLLKWGNMSPNTLIGKIMIDKPPVKIPEYIEPGGLYIEDLASYNFIDFCHRWMGLADIEEVINDIEEYYRTLRTPLYKGNGNLEHDKTKQVVAYQIDKTRPVHIKRPIPEYLKPIINKIRDNIELK